MANEKWTEQEAGIGCYLCLPRLAAHMSLTLIAQHSAFMQDLRQSIRAIREALVPDHLNVGLLGNSCPHLHWSIVPRYLTDPRWGRPIWDDATLREMKNSPVTLTAVEYRDLIENIRRLL